jgi:hypothetical protein
MATVIGVLGEASALTVATTTVYTVPSGKAAKVSIMYRCQVGAGGTGTLLVTVNGCVVWAKAATTASHYIYSTPSASMITGAAAPTGASTSTTVAPGPEIYYLSAGDIVSYTHGGEAATAMTIQVVGTEVDVT